MGRRTHPVRDDAFSDLTDPSAAYWLGFIAADGYVSEDHGSVQLTLSDPGHVSLFRAFLGSSAPIRLDPAGNSRVNIYSTALARSLASLGIGQAKSHTLTVPDLPESSRAPFWRGMLDGDGSIQRLSPLHSGGFKWRVTLTGTASICGGFAAFCAERTGRAPKLYPDHRMWQAVAKGTVKPAMILAALGYIEGFALPRKAALAAECITQPHPRGAYRNAA